VLSSQFQASRSLANIALVTWGVAVIHWMTQDPTKDEPVANRSRHFLRGSSVPSMKSIRSSTSPDSNQKQAASSLTSPVLIQQQKSGTELVTYPIRPVSSYQLKTNVDTRRLSVSEIASASTENIDWKDLL
jgi:hypothetical protein